MQGCVTGTCMQIPVRCCVNPEMNGDATADEVRAFGADKVILATGGLPNRPRIPGVDRENVYYAGGILRGRVLPEGRIVVAGGGEAGVKTAMHPADAEPGQITVLETTGGSR